MVKQWVPYDSLGRNLDTDMEKIMLYTSKADVDEVFAEIYSKNDEFFSLVKNTMVDRGYVTVKKAEEIISKFEVPNIE